MKFGLRPMEGGSDFTPTLEQIEAAEELGFDSVWFAEHYTPDEQWWPTSLLNLAAVASRTTEIELGSNIIVAPFYNPVWLANAVAMLDVISEGRFTCGLGVGYDPTEFDAFGVSLDDRVGRTIETTILLKKLWTQDRISFDGKHFSVDDYGIAPQPQQDPRPEIWYGVWGDYLLEQAAKRADAWIPGAVASREVLEEKQALYDDHLEGSPESRPLLRDIVIGETRTKAMEHAKDHLDEKYQIYAGRGHQFFEDYEADKFEEFARERIIVGTPEECIEEIKTYRDTLDLDHMIFRFTYPDMDTEETMETMETIATEVLPAFD
ncbi:LLM class flavin-dependent oxidoreductase [Natrinema sp. LN54]|uniref:LLM class flavin-dependent oxidoreductase n=1 Tax=Natrinema sp. LN54 TaxID=3458705 RepID=UPI004035B369